MTANSPPPVAPPGRRLRAVADTALALLALLVLGIRNVLAGPFAAPEPLSAPSTGGGTMRVVLALILVLGAIYAAAWLMRRLRGVGSAGTGNLQVISQVALGARERAVLLRAGDRQVLLGVSNGSVRFLCEVRGGGGSDGPVEGGGAAPADGDAATALAPQRPTFRDLLMRSLGK
jgi:flagellar protein FliO/FliZ